MSTRRFSLEAICISFEAVIFNLITNYVAININVLGMFVEDEIFMDVNCCTMVVKQKSKCGALDLKPFK